MMLMPRTCAARGLAISTSVPGSDLARVLLVDPGQDLHQRGFAGAVFADQRMHFAGAQFEVPLGDRVHAGEALLDTLHAHQDVARRAGGGIGCSLVAVVHVDPRPGRKAAHLWVSGSSNNDLSSSLWRGPFPVPLRGSAGGRADRTNCER